MIAVDTRPKLVGSRGEPRRRLRSLLILTPLLFGVPVVLGILISTVRLLGTRYPDLGWATTVNSDAEELYLGHTLYQNPAHGYSGLIYTPLFPALNSLIFHIYLWNGWPLLMVIGASVALATLAARIAFLPSGPMARSARVLAAAGIGGIAYWCVSSVPLSLLDEARADQVAWAFALFGLVAVADFGPKPSRKQVVLAALLLSAGIWTKQTAVGVAAVALIWVCILAATSLLSRKAAWLFVLVLFGVNLSVLLALNLLTSGWEFYINFEMATRQATNSLYSYYVILGLRSCALAIGLLGIVWLVNAVRAAIGLRRSSPRSSARTMAGSLRDAFAADDPTIRRAVLLGLYAAVGFVLAVYFLRKQGTETNQYIGVVWALGLVMAAGWHVAQRHAGTATAAGACIVLCFALIHLGSARKVAEERNVIIPALENSIQWAQISPELRLWADKHTFYAPLYADLNVPRGGPLYPNYYNFADKLAAGVQPMFLVEAFLNRDFESVEPFSLAEDAYTSGFGKWEENYAWKLNEVIAARYIAEPGTPKGVLVRRPGPEQAAWMRHCFGPFAIDGVSFRIFRGGGFWCSFEPSRLSLVRTPTPLSEVVTTKPVQLAGTLSVSLEAQPSSQINLKLEHGRDTWMVHVAPSPRNSPDVVVSTYLGNTLLGSKLVPTTRASGQLREVRLSIEPTHGNLGPPIPVVGDRVTLTAPLARVPLAIVASAGAAINLDAVHFGADSATGT
jgi:hypothetical protein